MRERRVRGARGRWIAVTVALAGCLVAGLPAAPAAPPDDVETVDDDTLLVRFKPGVDHRQAEAAVKKAGARRGPDVGRTGFVEVSTEGRSHADVEADLMDSGAVADVEPNRLRRASVTPSDPYFPEDQASYLSAVGLPRAWDTVTGSDDLILAVLDSGIDLNHPDLAAPGRILPGYDFVNDDSNPADDDGHGTMVSGVAAARTNNAVGVAGAAWRARILPVKVLDAGGVAFDADIIAGIEWAVRQGADVMNLSLGAPGASTPLCNALSAAMTAGVVVVAASGNLNAGDPVEPHYPAACPGVIAVGATDRAGTSLASFSNYGDWLDLVAPGVNITTTDEAAGTAQAYAYVTGTSFAAPLVAGAVLLLRAADPGASVATLADRLRRSARDLGPAGYDVRHGAGLLDVAAALRLSTTAGSPGGTGTQVRSGYWAVGSDGRVYDFGNAGRFGDAAGLATRPIVDIEPAPGGTGYWLVDDRGAVFAFNAPYHGRVEPTQLQPGETVTSLSSTPQGTGYWLFTNLGRAFSLGAARHFGDMAGRPLNGPVLDSVPTSTGNGYFMVSSDGGIFAFGDAVWVGSTGDRILNAPVQSLVPDPDGHGYWLVASDGGVFAFSAGFRGSMGGQPLNKPVTGMVAFGDGYLMVAEDGGIFNYSNLPFSGSLGDMILPAPIVAVAPLPV